jgi:uncharacterized membrane protein
VAFYWSGVEDNFFNWLFINGYLITRVTESCTFFFSLLVCCKCNSYHKINNIDIFNFVYIVKDHENLKLNFVQIVLVVVY